MNEYQPDRWVIIELKNKGETLYKVLAGWSGSYLYGESWKLNSGITEVEDKDDYYLFHGYSSSVYKCYKKSYGFNNMTASVLESLKKQAEDVEDVEIELLEYTSVVERYTHQS